MKVYIIYRGFLAAIAKWFWHKKKEASFWRPLRVKQRFRAGYSTAVTSRKTRPVVEMGANPSSFSETKAVPTSRWNSG